MDPGDVAAAWQLTGPLTIRPTGSGINNLTWFLETSAASYVLRVYRNTRNVALVRYEHAILLGLGRAELSFRVPVPQATRRGDTLATLPNDALAALFPLLPGAPPDRAALAQVRACAAALAELHAALRRLDVGPPPPGYAAYGELDRIHPLVPAPWSLAENLPLPLPPSDRTRIEAILADLRAAAPALYRALPEQLCHNDYGPGNTLQIGGRTSAVLDFEFAGPDLPAVDVAVGWYWSVGRGWGRGDELGTIGAFLDGYAEASPLTPSEAEAMPTLARLQRATALVHWLGRSRAGLDPDGLLAEQAQRLLDLDAWLAVHGAELVVLASRNGRGTGPSPA